MQSWQWQYRYTYPIAFLVIAVTTLVLYAGVVLPRDPDIIYPWSSDTWGHLVKAVYLREQISLGIWYPDLFPEWYSGQQMLRYFPPIAYYALVGLNEFTDNIYMASNYLLFITALVGGASLLLFAPRIGPIDWVSVIRPALMKPINSTIEALLWMSPPIKVPSPSPVSRLRVAFPSRVRMPSPTAAESPVLIVRIPKINSAIPPSSAKII